MLKNFETVINSTQNNVLVVQELNLSCIATNLYNQAPSYLEKVRRVAAMFDVLRTDAALRLLIITINYS